MTKDNVIALPNPNLRRKSDKVGIITPEILRIIEDMKSATISWDHSREHEVGVALAAVQINQPYKIIVVRNDYENKDDVSFSTFINPSIIKLEGKLEEDYEGCLSVQDIYGKVPRHTKVKVKAIDEHGRAFRVTAEGFLARIFQHEIDHVSGVLFIDHIKDKSDAFFKLKKDGTLEQLDYEKFVKNNRDLWNE